LGFYISFSGIITFKSAGDLREVAKKVPLDRILVETDAPYLTRLIRSGNMSSKALPLPISRVFFYMKIRFIGFWWEYGEPISSC
jgi:Tat protein secretion system quality control protein TatD with DNase activity